MKNPLIKLRRRGAVRNAAPMPAVAGQAGAQGYYNDEVDDSSIGRATRITWLSSLAIAALLVWSWFAEVVEVSTGDGRVIPISREQVIQSLEGGILLDLLRSEEHTSELQSRPHLVCRLLLEKKKKKNNKIRHKAKI